MFIIVSCSSNSEDSSFCNADDNSAPYPYIVTKLSAVLSSLYIIGKAIVFLTGELFILLTNVLNVAFTMLAGFNKPIILLIVTKDCNNVFANAFTLYATPPSILKNALFCNIFLNSIVNFLPKFVISRTSPAYAAALSGF